MTHTMTTMRTAETIRMNGAHHVVLTATTIAVRMAGITTRAEATIHQGEVDMAEVIKTETTKAAVAAIQAAADMAAGIMRAAEDMADSRTAGAHGVGLTEEARGVAHTEEVRGVALMEVVRGVAHTVAARAEVPMKAHMVVVRREDLTGAHATTWAEVTKVAGAGGIPAAAGQTITADTVTQTATGTDGTFSSVPVKGSATPGMTGLTATMTVITREAITGAGSRADATTIATSSSVPATG
jgi:hypothetical protein